MTTQPTQIRQYAKQCLEDEAQALLELIPQLDENFDKAVNMIYNCKGKIIVTGVGKSGHIGAKIAATLSSTGTPAFFINPLDVFHGDLGVMTSDDIVLALSNSGQTDELLRFIPMVLHMNIPIISMTGQRELAARKIQQCPHQGVGEEGGLPAQPRPDKQHHRRTGNGRRSGSSSDGGKTFRTSRFRPVPPRWRVGQTPADHS